MKKILLVAIIFSAVFKLFAQIPESLYGIWEGKDRFVFFEKTENNETDYEDQVVIVLKEYYGWYYDRAAEPEEYNKKVSRTRNTGTTRKAEQVYLSVQPVSKAETHPEVMELNLKYSNFQSSKVAVAVLNDNMYLDFYVQSPDDKNYYRGTAVSQGIKVSEQSIPQNISCYYFNKDKVFDIRYWFSDMDYSSETVLLKYDDFEADVDKHIFSCGNNYSCVTGRSKKIRNVVEPEVFNKDDFLFNEDSSVLVVDNQPYLTKMADRQTFEDLMSIVKAGNSRRKPDPAPIFPPNSADWHWDLIDQLESNNELIQAVRQRQKEFGPRGRDINQ